MGGWFSRARDAREEKRKNLRRLPIQEEIIQHEIDVWYNPAFGVDYAPPQLPKRDNIVEEPLDVEKMVEDAALPQYVNSDELIEQGRIQELINAILNDVRLKGKWQPVNYAARCGQFELVN